MEILEFIRRHALTLPPLAKFALGMALIFGIPPLSRRVRLPGSRRVSDAQRRRLSSPDVYWRVRRAAADCRFPRERGKAAVDVCRRSRMTDLVRFRQTQGRSVAFGLIAAAAPLLSGAADRPRLSLRRRRRDRPRGHCSHPTRSSRSPGRSLSLAPTDWSPVTVTSRRTAAVRHPVVSIDARHLRIDLRERLFGLRTGAATCMRSPSLCRSSCIGLKLAPGPTS